MILIATAVGVGGWLGASREEAASTDGSSPNQVTSAKALSVLLDCCGIDSASISSVRRHERIQARADAPVLDYLELVTRLTATKIKVPISVAINSGGELVTTARTNSQGSLAIWVSPRLLRRLASPPTGMSDGH